MKFRLEKNWSDKYQSFQIDTINLGLNIQAPIIMSHADVIKDSEKYDQCSLSQNILKFVLLVFNIFAYTLLFFITTALVCQCQNGNQLLKVYMKKLNKF